MAVTVKLKGKIWILNPLLSTFCPGPAGELTSPRRLAGLANDLQQVIEFGTNSALSPRLFLSICPTYNDLHLPY